MKNIKVIFTIATSIFLLSCSDEWLDVVPKDRISAVTVFNDEKSADLALMDVYSCLPDEEGWGNGMSAYYQYDSFENWSDNTVSCFDWALSFKATQERSMGADIYNPGWYNHDYPALPFIYDKVYGFIRKANFFIQNVNLYSKNFSEDWKKERLAEARFLRAFFYHEVWMAYGGVPIIKKPLNIATDGDSIFYPRATFQETGEFIINELREIANDLPNEVSKGRATRAAALTLKAWCELFMHNYNDAAISCQEVINLGVHGLYPDYNGLFMGENNNNVESIFAYQHDGVTKKSLRSGYYGPIGSYNTSSCADRSGSMQPAQSLIDEYKMKDGLPIDQSPLWDPHHPYDNREPRFYASIIYDGAEFAGKTYANPGDLYNLQRGIYTGYFRRKGIDPTLNTTQLGLAQESSNFIFFRYADVLLMYAEAKIELNQIDQSVLDAINAVRLRGGIPKLEDSYHKSTFSQDELRNILRSERRIELAFECKRYWDLIRWRTAEIVLNQNYEGMTKDNNGNYTRVLIKSCKFNQRNYLFPIYQAWIDANPKMKAQNDGVEFFNGQNPGY
jgi:hypothetical protein